MATKVDASGSVRLDGTAIYCDVTPSEKGFLAVVVTSVHNTSADGKIERTDYPVSVYGEESQRPLFDRLMALTVGGEGTKENFPERAITVMGIPVVNGDDGQLFIRTSAGNITQRDIRKAEKAEINLVGSIERIARREKMTTVTIGVDGGSLKVDFMKSVAGPYWDALGDDGIKTGHKVSVTGSLRNHVLVSDNGRVSHFSIVGKKFEDVTLSQRRKAAEKKTSSMKIR